MVGVTEPGVGMLGRAEGRAAGMSPEHLSHMTAGQGQLRGVSEGAVVGRVTCC